MSNESKKEEFDPRSLDDHEHHEIKFDRRAQQKGGFNDAGSFASRHLPKQDDSWLSMFFGTRSLQKNPKGALHPCKIVNRELHQCLDKNEDRYDFCRSKTNMFEACLREYGL